MSKMAKGKGAAKAAPNAYQQRLDEEHQEVSAEQRAWFNSIAEKLANDEPLDYAERAMAGAACRLAAATFPDQRPRPRGHQAQFDQLEAWVKYVALVDSGAFKSKAAVVDHLAEFYGVTVEAFRQALGKFTR